MFIQEHRYFNRLVVDNIPLLKQNIAEDKNGQGKSKFDVS